MTSSRSILHHPARAVAVVLAMLVLAAPVQAASFAQTELTYDNALFSQFNLINLNTFSSNGSQIGGRAVVGGNATLNNNTICNTAGACGNSTKAIDGTGASTGYGALTVFGNLVGGATIGSSQAVGAPAAGTGGDIDVKGSVGNATYNLNNAGGVNLGGTSTLGTVATQVTEYRTTQLLPPSGLGSSQGSNFNAGASGTNQTLAQVFAPFGNASTVANDFTAPAKALYAGLANLPGSPGVNAEALPPLTSSIFTSSSPGANGRPYDYTANGKNYGVITTSLADLAAQKTGFGIANGAGNSATFVIVTGTYDGTAATLLPSLAGSGQNVIYDFVGATSLKLGNGSNFNASILAPLATLTEGTTGSISGTVIVAAMTQTVNLYTGAAFTGDLTGLQNFQYNARVPEPASLTLLAAGLGIVLWSRRPHKA